MGVTLLTSKLLCLLQCQFQLQMMRRTDCATLKWMTQKGILFM